MACGRPKNLEIACRKLLCGLRDRRRNFFTTRDGNRRRGNPEPPGKGRLRALRQEGARRHWRRGNSEPRVWGKPRAHLAPGNSWASGHGEARVPPGKGETPGQPGEGKTFQAYGGGETRVICGKESPEPPRRREDFELIGLGETPVIWQEESSEPPAREILGATRLGGNPGWLAARKARAGRRGKPRATGGSGQTGPPERSWPW